MMLRNDFAFFEVSGARGGAGQPGGADQLASEGRGSRLHPGRQRRQNPGLPCRPAAADQGRPARPMCKLLVVTTPPEIAAAFNVPPALTQGPRRHDRLGPLARHACAVAGSSDRQRADVLYVGHDGAAQGRAPQADDAGTGRGLGAGRRHRLWRQAERGSGHPDERPDVPFGAEFLWHAGVPQRLHRSCSNRASIPRTCCS